MGKAMANIAKDAGALTSQLTKLGDTAEVGIGSESQLIRYDLRLQDAADKVEILRAKLAEVGSTTFTTAEYDELARQLQTAETTLATLLQRMEMMNSLGVSESSNGFQRLALQIQEAQENVDALLADIGAMEKDGSAYVSGDQTQQYAQMVQQLQTYEAELQRLQGLEQDYASSLQQQAAAKEQQAAAKDQAKAEAAAEREADADTAARQKAKAEAMQQLRSAALGAAKAVASISVNSVKALGSAVGATINPFSQLIKSSKKASMSTAGLVKALTGFKRMLLSRIKRTFISAIFKDLQAGMRSFAKYSTSFNSAMSAIKNSMTGLAGNIGIAAGNLLSLFAPAITAIIDLISKAITYINAFFALMSGKSTYTVAAKGTADYAKGLKGAGGAAKDLNSQVFKFDELNKEQDKSGGGGGGGSSAKMTEEALADLPGGVLAFMESIKSAFSAGEFEVVGQTIAQGFNGIIPIINNWITGTLQPMAITWSANIARILNGIVSGLNWPSLGSLFANGLNTIFYTANTFVQTFNWSALGTGIAQGINGMVADIDW